MCWAFVAHRASNACTNAATFYLCTLLPAYLWFTVTKKRRDARPLKLRAGLGRHVAAGLRPHPVPGLADLLHHQRNLLLRDGVVVGSASNVGLCDDPHAAATGIDNANPPHLQLRH